MSIENQKKVMDELTKKFPEFVSDVKIPRLDRAFATVTRDSLRDVIRYLKENHGFVHITTITAVDLPDSYEVVYHLRSDGFNLNIKALLPKDEAVVPSITDILNGAVLYEREVNDLMGIYPEGHPNPSRLILAYDWPDGVYPLRKEWSIQEIRERVDGERWGRNE
jgi:membrane-bound hydrogenase subunit beta